MLQSVYSLHLLLDPYHHAARLQLHPPSLSWLSLTSCHQQKFRYPVSLQVFGPYFQVINVN